MEVYFPIARAQGYGNWRGEWPEDFDFSINNIRDQNIIKKPPKYEYKNKTQVSVENIIYFLYHTLDGGTRENPNSEGR